jgi:hypothetical protein
MPVTKKSTRGSKATAQKNVRILKNPNKKSPTVTGRAFHYKKVQV